MVMIKELKRQRLETFFKIIKSQLDEMEMIEFGGSKHSQSVSPDYISFFTDEQERTITCSYDRHIINLEEYDYDYLSEMLNSFLKTDNYKLKIFCW